MANTLTDPSKAWNPNEWIGATVTITEGLGAGQSRGVVGNSATSLTVSPDWTIDPVGGNFKYKLVLSVLTGVIRGEGGTAPEPHPPGTLVLEIKDEIGHRFLIAGHACQAVRNVKMDGAIQLGGYTVELANTTLIPGRTVCLLTFAKLPVLDGGGTGEGGGGGSAGMGTVTVVGTVNPTNCHADRPSWLRGNVAWRARISMAVLIDTGVTGLAELTLNGDANNLSVFLDGPNVHIPAAVVQVQDGRAAAVAATTAAEVGANRSRSQVGFTLGAPGESGAEYNANGIMSLVSSSPGLLDFVPVGSCYFTGLVVEFDFLPEHVITPEGSTATPTVLPAGDTGAMAPATKQIFDMLRRISVTCDVDGYEDDDDGTITGTAGALVELPGDIDRHIGTVLLSEPASTFDTASYAHARARHVELGYTHNIVINSPTQLQALFAYSARQSRCWVFSDGGKIYRVFLETPTSAALHLERRHFRERPPVWGSTDRTFIKTVFAMRHSLRWAPGVFQFVQSANVTTGLYPLLQAVEDFPYVGPSVVMAGDLLAWDIAFFGRPHRLVRVQTFWNHTALEVGDVIRFAPPSELVGGSGQRTWDDGPDAWWDQPQYTWDEALRQDPQGLAELWLGLLFRVYRIQVDHGRNVLELEAIEL